MSNTITKDEAKEKIYKAFDSISGVVSNFIANEYDKMIVSNGSARNQCLHPLSKQFILDDVPSSLIR
jgi:hypothetical protein